LLKNGEVCRPGFVDTKGGLGNPEMPQNGEHQVPGHVRGGSE